MDYKEILNNDEQRNKLFSAIKEGGYNIYNSEQQEELLKNYSEDIVKKTASDRTSEIYNSFDQQISELTGAAKNPNEKTIDYTVRSFKEQIQQITDLKEKLNASYSESDRVKELEKIVTNLTEEKESILKNKDLELGKFKKEQVLKSLISKFKFKKDIPEKLLNNFISSELEDLYNISDWQDDKLVYKDKEGNILRDNTNLALPYTSEQILQERFNDFLEVERQVNGSGSQVNDNTEKKFTIDNNVRDFVLQTPPRDLNELTSKLQEYYTPKGIYNSSSEFIKTYQEIKDRLNLQ